MESKQAILEELLGNSARDCVLFNIDWILTSQATEEDMRQNHSFLTQIGLNNDKIATHAHLLGRDLVTLQRNYEVLQRLGLKDDKIASQASLLGRDLVTLQRNYEVLQGMGLKDDKIATLAHLLGNNPVTLQRNYVALQGMGLKDDKIASRAELLGMNPVTLQRNYVALQGMGLKDDKIASRAELLGMNPVTLQRNYDNLQNYFDKATIATHANLLSMSSHTIVDNVNFLERIGVDYRVSPLILGTNVNKKKEKLRNFFQIVFDEDVVDKQLEGRALAFFTTHNDGTTIKRTLIRSTAYHQRNREALRRRYNPTA